jgi:hypothetical protein
LDAPNTIFHILNGKNLIFISNIWK